MSPTKLVVVSALCVLAACPSDPGPCQPGDATFSRLGGSVTVEGGLNQTFDRAAAPGSAPCTITSRASGDRDANAETRTTVDLTCESGGERLLLSFEIDDSRRLGAGAHALQTDDSGLRISYRATASAPECYTYLADVPYQLDVTEATGEFAPYPALVTGDFHRRLEIALDLSLHGRKALQYTNGVVEDCTLEFAGAFDFTAQLDATDFAARDVNSCIGE